jgi:hypothetical protein
MRTSCSLPWPHFPAAAGGATLALVRRASAGLVLLSVLVVRPAPATAETVPSALDQDRQLTSLARQTLQTDPLLAPHNLGVTVRNRVATLWGPVPSVGLALRAEELLRTLPGLTQVRSDLRIEAGAEQEPPRSSSPASRSPATPQWRPVGESLPGREKRRNRPPTLFTGTAGSAPPAPDAGPHRQPAQRHVEVLPSIGVPVPAAQVSPPVPQTHHPSNPAPPELEQRMRQLQLREIRFHGIESAVRGGFVYLRSRGASPADLFQFAQVLGQLPGVECVIVAEAPMAARP